MKIGHGRRVAAIAMAATFLAAGAYAKKSKEAAPKPAAVRAESSELAWMSYDEAFKLAAQTHKPMVVDVYTTWCGWCRRMDATTYKDPKVVAALKENFVLVRLNAESAKALTYKAAATTERDLSHEVFGVTGYPTTVFLKPDGEIIGMQPGYLDGPTLHSLLQYVGTGAYEKMKYAEFAKKNS